MKNHNLLSVQVQTVPKKNRVLRAEEITPIPQSFFFAGKSAEFFAGRKTAFSYVFEKPAIFQKIHQMAIFLAKEVSNSKMDHVFLARL